VRNIWIIARREFRLYFTSPLAYVVAAVIFLILGGLFFINIYIGLQTGQISPDGRAVVPALVTILLFVTPAITMRLVADEQRMGTIELLLTSPVRDFELIVGKWLGSMGFMLAVVALTLVYPLMLHRMTDPGIDLGVLFSTYLGLVFYLGALLAIGVLVSTFTNSPVAAFFITLGLILFLWIVGGFARGSGSSDWIRALSFVDHFYDNLYRGVVDVGDLLYYASLSILALFLGSQVLTARRWR
jgi:ABC-2 type transport system permease protein